MQRRPLPRLRTCYDGAGLRLLVQPGDFWFNRQFWCKARRGRGGETHPHLSPLPSRERRAGAVIGDYDAPFSIDTP